MFAVGSNPTIRMLKFVMLKTHLREKWLIEMPITFTILISIMFRYYVGAVGSNPAMRMFKFVIRKTHLIEK
jgi:hypothetical protein